MKRRIARAEEVTAHLVAAGPVVETPVIDGTVNLLRAAGKLRDDVTIATRENIAHWQRIVEPLAVTARTLRALPGYLAARSQPFIAYTMAGITNTNERTLLTHAIPLGAAVAEPLTLAACPGEYEPASFCLWAREKLDNVTVTCSDLEGPAGAISADAVDVRILKCWFQAGVGMEDVTHKTLTPELLLHDDSIVRIDPVQMTNIIPGAENVDPFTIRDAERLLPFTMRANELKQLWVLVHVPEDAQPGTYVGKLAVEVSGKQSDEVALRLTVRPFKLAESILLYGLYYKSRIDAGEKMREAIKKYYDGHPDQYLAAIQGLRTRQQVKAELANMVAHGVTLPYSGEYIEETPGLGGPRDYMRVEEMLEMMKEAGMRDDIVLYAATGTAHRRDVVENMVRIVREHGFKDLYFASPVDEPSPEQLRQAWPALEMIHAAGAKINVATNGTTLGSPGAVDMLDMVILSGPRAWYADRMRAAGHLLLSYDNPMTAVEEPLTFRRNRGLALWKAGFDGVCEYAYLSSCNRPWDDFDHPRYRDFAFSYPTADGVIDTIQGEGFREAVDDVRYLSTLLAAMKTSKNAKLIQETQKWLDNLDPFADLDRIREEMAKRIESLQAEP